MSVKKFAAEMKATIEDIKSKGTAAIYCDNIIAYLDEVLKSPEPTITPFQMEHYKAQLQKWIDEHKHQHEGDLEMFRSVITAGQGAIKSSFLLNGSAAVALLAFIAHLAQFDAGKVSTFAECLILFTIGALAVAVTSGFTYLSQWLYAGDYRWSEKAGFVLNIFCILLGISSYGMFTWGLFATYHAFVAYT